MPNEGKRNNTEDRRWSNQNDREAFATKANVWTDASLLNKVWTVGWRRKWQRWFSGEKSFSNEAFVKDLFVRSFWKVHFSIRLGFRVNKFLGDKSPSDDKRSSISRWNNNLWSVDKRNETFLSAISPKKCKKEPSNVEFAENFRIPARSNCSNRVDKEFLRIDCKAVRNATSNAESKLDFPVRSIEFSRLQWRKNSATAEKHLCSETFRRCQRPSRFLASIRCSNFEFVSKVRRIVDSERFLVRRQFRKTEKVGLESRGDSTPFYREQENWFRSTKFRRD